MKTKTIVTFFLISMLTLGCTEDKTDFSTQDLQGVWSGSWNMEFHGGDLDGTQRNYDSHFTFNADGTLQSIEGHPVFLSNQGQLSVSNNGNITGVITTTHDTNPGIETTSENWNGCYFRTKSTIRVNMRWNWTNTRPGSGYYIITGDLGKDE